MTDYIDKMMKTAGVEIHKVKPIYCNKNQKNIPCEFCIEQWGKCLLQREIYPASPKPSPSSQRLMRGGGLDKEKVKRSLEDENT